MLALPVAASAQPYPPQTAPTAPIVLSRLDEILLARSAAPPGVSREARVYVLEKGKYVVAEHGTSGAACMVIRSQVLSLEPECADAEGDATVMAMERVRVELRYAGRTNAEIDRAVNESLASGRLRLPRRPAMVYMMSSGQILYDENQKFVGRWMPHAMLYYPFLTSSEIGLAPGPTDIAGPIVDKPGTPYSNVMTVVRTFVNPAPAP